MAARGAIGEGPAAGVKGREMRRQMLSIAGSAPVRLRPALALDSPHTMFHDATRSAAQEARV